MIKCFKFFHGITDESNEIQSMVRRLRAHWQPEPIDVDQELTRMLSNEIVREIDSNIIQELTRRINGGDNHGIDYLNHWIRIGDNRA